MPLPVVLPDRPKILFVGINPGLGSERRGHHFAGPGNPFWRLLHASGLTQVLLTPEEDERLAEFGFGLVNLCDRPTRTAAELTRDELERGRARLRERVLSSRPDILALVGITIFRVVFPSSKKVGPEFREEAIGDARTFVLPNPSGLNASYPSFEAKAVWFRALSEAARSRRTGDRSRETS